MNRLREILNSEWAWMSYYAIALILIQLVAAFGGVRMKTGYGVDSRGMPVVVWVPSRVE